MQVHVGQSGVSGKSRTYKQTYPRGGFEQHFGYLINIEEGARKASKIAKIYRQTLYTCGCACIWDSGMELGMKAKGNNTRQIDKYVKTYKGG